LIKIYSELCELRASAVKSLFPFGCGFAALGTLWFSTYARNQENGSKKQTMTSIGFRRRENAIISEGWTLLRI
jgi:hypothetical protein